MANTLRPLIFLLGCAGGAMIGFAAEPKELPKPKVAIHWVEHFPINGVTVERSVHSGSDTRNDYYPYIKPAMILTKEDVAETRLHQVDWPMNGSVAHLYVVSLVLTKDARERLARNCPSKSACVSTAVDDRFWGWDHYTTENAPEVSERWKASNYSPGMGLMSHAEAMRIVNAFK